MDWGWDCKNRSRLCVKMDVANTGNASFSFLILLLLLYVYFVPLISLLKPTRFNKTFLVKLNEVLQAILAYYMIGSIFITLNISELDFVLSKKNVSWTV